MTEKKHSTPWKDRPTVEQITLIVGWSVIASLLVYGFLPSKPESTAATESVASDVRPNSTQYIRASEAALASATRYLSQLDSAMAEGAQILKANNLSELSAHSQTIKSLRGSGQTQFGRSVFEPLGHCSSAGIFAHSWWQAQVAAVPRGGPEPIPGSTQSNLDEYRANRAECLRTTDPSINVASTNE